MNGAPNWMYNAEVLVQARAIKGLRIGAEVQHIGDYYADAKNTSKYKGYTVLNLRAGYEFRSMEIWINALNVADTLLCKHCNKKQFGLQLHACGSGEYKILASHTILAICLKQTNETFINSCFCSVCNITDLFQHAA
jgi:hypothetical protein